ncbi:hypothetical protein [Actinomyces oris]|uniref:hypothetical protein n=1 Tax=Actinomyces oris TaxID=544580 RepID=UPI0028F0DF80|nr:hypothetical protein [Actinomyces oris]
MIATTQEPTTFAQKRTKPTEITRVTNTSPELFAGNMRFAQINPEQSKPQESHCVVPHIIGQ